MKKTLGIILAVLLTLMLSVPAFAEDNIATGGNGSANQDVNATFTPGGTNDVAKVYYVTVAWSTEGSTLTYTEGNATYTWNATDMKYEGGDRDAGTWTGEAKVTVTVTNQSNDDITATAEWTKENSITSVTQSFDNTSVTVESAAKGVTVAAGQSGTAKQNTITATIKDVQGSITQSNTKIGTITVTIAPKPAV